MMIFSHPKTLCGFDDWTLEFGDWELGLRSWVGTATISYCIIFIQFHSCTFVDTLHDHWPHDIINE